MGFSNVHLEVIPLSDKAVLVALTAKFKTVLALT